MPDIIVMFFLLGLVAGLVKSNLTIPHAAYDTLSLLLMLTIGLKGGMAMYGNLSWGLIPEMVGVAALGGVIPLILAPLLRRVVRLSAADSASLAAHYGSVSAGTFAVALAYVESRGLAAGAETTLYLVMMELPAIMVGIALYRRFQGNGGKSAVMEGLWHETLTNRGVILLAGGVMIGALYGPLQGATVTDLYTGAFHGVLALFLLEMGLTAAETLRPLPVRHWRLLAFALAAPLVLALAGIAMGVLLGLPEGSVLILAALTASASYIAAPAAMRTAIPEANIGLAMLASLGVTFPFNVLVGIPLYHQLTQWF
ncbi:sodium-dependent bicarbonate transport family permease [Litchfieldella qijiaojingensis]|uniref:Sodium-dependent bicarbonate transport family permease n=1 Tax=Litchfieldella qijiaojingensis TaxID=980347 RepID=A0ABQ2YLE0_9GAMM|nr:sodium-dependent bicarbonate transport family permease [Halomonas qijiaojingensis]GGX85844.1 sodium-dependent bicarbonate transport family permease [Halomonas qijiaojingensis]